MSVLLTRLDCENGYQPFAYLEEQRRKDAASGFALVARSTSPMWPLGTAYWPGFATEAPAIVSEALAHIGGDPHASAAGRRSVKRLEADGATFLLIPLELPPRLLVLGAGPDVIPLVEIAGIAGWRVCVLDHRPAYATAERFRRANRVASQPAAQLGAELTRARYDAAVVMSHHLISDQIYLTALADSAVPYIGLLGPAPRRMRLMAEIGPAIAARLEGRLYGPVGLDIGAKTPETIALSIVSEIQAVLAGRNGGSFSRALREG
jgi:xanthine/CO dehydrogenase XdhC/CoxF family maturation factor